MALVPITVYGNPFTSVETTFLQALADHAYTDGQLIIGNSATGRIAFATLTQGSGVTITNGNGSITIAASGGGSFSVLVPTSGIVDGSNKVFTFASAPSVIVLDNSNIMNKVQSDTTTNWSGTTTVTLNTAPTFNIFGY